MMLRTIRKIRTRYVEDNGTSSRIESANTTTRTTVQQPWIMIDNLATLELAKKKVPTNPDIKQLVIGSGGSGLPTIAMAISVVDLSTVIDGCRENLEDFGLRYIHLTGGNIPVFVEALGFCKNLINFTWWTANSQQWQEGDAVALGRALAQLPKLEKIEIDVDITTVVGQKPWSLEIILPVLQRPNNILKDVCSYYGNHKNVILQPPKEDIVVGNEKLCHFLQASAASTNLVKMFIHSICLGSSQLKAACDLLQQKSSSLEYLTLSIARNFDLVSLLECLQVNRSIKRMAISGPSRSGGVPGTNNGDLFNAFEKNKAVHKLEAMMLLDVLQHHNHTLEDVTICPWMWPHYIHIPHYSQKQTSQRAWQKAMATIDRCHLPNHDFHPILAGIFLFLDLNRKGKKRQLLGSSKPPEINDCINCIAKHKDDLSVIFYYLQQTVSYVFDPSSATTTGNCKRKSEVVGRQAMVER